MPSPSHLDGMGPNLRAFYERPYPRCNCTSCGGKFGVSGIRCAITLARDQAVRRDRELLEPTPIRKVDPNDALFSEETVSASDLNPAEKRKVWEHIKNHRPDVMAFVMDPQIQAFIERTGATHAFPADMVMDALGYHPGYSDAA